MTPFKKTCACGKSYNRQQWDALQEVGTNRHDWGEVHLLRNCTCGSTLVEVLEPGEKQDPIVGDIWKAKDGRQHIKIVDVAARGVSYRVLRSKSRGFVDFAGFYATFTPAQRSK